MGGRSRSTSPPARATLHFDWDLGGRVLLEPTGTELEQLSRNRYTIAEGDPLSARAEHETGHRPAPRRQLGRPLRGNRLADRDRDALPCHDRPGGARGRNPAWARTWTFAVPRDNT